MLDSGIISNIHKIIVGFPRILILPDSQEEGKREKFFLRRNYLESLQAFGALPFIVSYTQEYLEAYVKEADGVLIAGGNFTIDPALFSQTMQSRLPVCAERTTAEWKVFELALARGLPILGICGGMQLINVALGGSLIQYLPAQKDVMEHRGQFPEFRMHDVTVSPDSRLAQLLTGHELTFATNTSHEQAIDKLGRELYINAQTADGVIEGIELRSQETTFCVGVQWHPEYLLSVQDRVILETFVRSCAEKRSLGER